MNQYLKKIQELLQQNNQLTEQDREALIKSISEADKQWIITEFKLDRTEKVKKTTSILLEETIEELEHKRKAVEAQNRELEIESSLERIRTVAMSMNKPDDMLQVCRVISEQLQYLHVQEIRNVQTAIFYETKGTYINYEFYAKHDETLITEVDYKNHSVQKGFAEQMLKGPNEIFIHSFKGKEVQDWYEFQATTNVFLDTYLETAGSLNYYWYSLGPVALGISTYKPLSEEETNLFKRFVKVFELSYRRYLDIEKAEVQAHEAMIEASLERMRAAAMSMRKSEELITVCEAMYKELTVLGFTNIRNAQIAIKNDAKQSYLVCEYSDYNVTIMQEAPYDSSPIVQELYHELEKSKDALYQKEFSGKEFDDWRTWREGISTSIDSRVAGATSMCFYLYSIGTGHLGISTFNAITIEQVEILKRFRNVFELSYRRYIDVAQAEAQAREAQIELALERVRARTMAMQKSEELAETSFVLFQQFKDLGETSEQISIGIFNEDEHVMELYSTLYGSQWKEAAKVDLDEPVVVKKIHAAWKEQKKSLVIDLAGNDLLEYNAYRKKLSNLEYREDRWVIHITFFSKGVLTFSTSEPRPHETIQLLERFGVVFDGTYTRFLDLQKAEAQAREAKIEAALERVRSRSLAMHNSGELSEVVDIVFEKLHELNIIFDGGVAIQTFTEGSKDSIIWITDPRMSSSSAFKLPYPKNIINDQRIISDFWNEKEKKMDLISHAYSFEDKNAYFNYVFKYSELRHLPNDVKSGILSTEGYAHSVAIEKNSAITVSSFLGKLLSSKENEILKRFAKVFEQAYIRFLDLQKAEAQAREAKIEAALERTRTQSMIMQHSNELDDTLRVFHQQVLFLGIHSAFSFLWLPDEDKDRHIFWAAWAENNSKVFKSKAINYPLDRNEPATAQCLVDWKSNKPVYSYHVPPAAVENYFAAWKELIDGVEQLKPEYFCGGLYYVEAFMKYGCFGVMVATDLTEDEKKILGRFAVEFERTYTRFLDLQKAEARARESQIEAALEKVRSRSLAVHKCDEFKEVIKVIFERLQELGFQATSVSINTFIKDSNDTEVYICGQSEIGKVISGFRLPYFNSLISNDRLAAQKNNLDFFSKTYNSEDKNLFYDLAFELSDLKLVPDEIKKMVYESERYTISLALAKNSMIVVNDFAGNVLSENEIDIIKRFARVFEQAYIRFLDLQKAEEQARESQIQLALERVRARTMAMHQSNELAETASILFQQIKELGFETWSCGFCIWQDATTAEVWMGADSGGLLPPLMMPYKEEQTHFEIFKAAQAGATAYDHVWEGDALLKHYDFLQTIPSVRTALEMMKAAGLSLPSRQCYSVGFFKKGYLLLITKEPGNELKEISRRFAQVFDLTYTRFLDLQQAEAQARESQIQLALERVRARTMAMQKSHELKYAATLLFQQAKALGVPAYSCGYNIWEKGEKEFTSWMSTQDGSDINGVPNIPLTEDANFIRYVESKQNGEPFFVLELRGERMQEHYEYLKTIPAFKAYFDYAVSVGFDLPQIQIHHVANFSQGNLLFITLEPCPEFHDVFKRFAVVFEQTYTRFLDLQKAEAQAREAKIEAALERVRSRSMAMQKSEELKEVIQVVYDQFVHLNIHIEHTGFIMDYKESDDMHIWLADKHAVPFQVTIPYFDSAHWNSFNEAKEKGMDFFANHLSFEEKNRFYQDLFKLIPGVPEETLEYYFSCAGLAISTVLLENVGLYIENFSGISYSDEENATLMRFGKVFQQTYTRFNDLQKAEAQAREAQIEAALERVRSRSMGMQKSEELRDVIQVIFEQLIQLNFDIQGAGFAVDFRESDDWNLWTAYRNVQYPYKLHIPYFDHPLSNAIIEAKKNGLELLVVSLTFEEKNSLLDYFFKYAPAPPDVEEELYNSPGYVMSKVLCRNVDLFIQRYTGIPFTDAENATLIRFAKVFEQTYIRFNDLKQAEAQAREATKQASLDRVRGQIASMRSTEDLQRITPLIWHELTMLDVPFIRCGVLIIDETKAEAHIYLSSPDGHSLAAMNLPIQSNTLTANSVEYWRKGIVYIEHWDEKDFVHWMQSMIEQGQVQNPETYQGAAKPPESLHLHFVPFTQGMMYVGNTALLTNDEIDLVKSLAEAFSIAYARYEDFTKLEKAKQSIEITLTELKATQTQLIQSEKMASLGELTAGIAHEIQNPLNFVNNFSEVNKELLAELSDEIEKGNYEEVKIIANDVIVNEEKIGHHGRRADAIVKGMLQHSRSSTGVKEPTEINALADEYLRLAYHGLRAKDKSFNATLKTNYDETIGKINIIPQDIGRVLLNLYNNAFYAVKPLNPRQLAGENYEPTVTVSTKLLKPPPTGGGLGVLLTVKDNGNGIPQKALDKIFQPFFTTKPTGQGTGLGLSLAYDIVKSHGGEIKVKTKEGEGSEFIIQLPVV